MQESARRQTLQHERHGRHDWHRSTAIYTTDLTVSLLGLIEARSGKQESHWTRKTTFTRCWSLSSASQTGKFPLGVRQLALGMHHLMVQSAHQYDWPVTLRGLVGGIVCPPFGSQGILLGVVHLNSTQHWMRSVIIRGACRTMETRRICPWRMTYLCCRANDLPAFRYSPAYLKSLIGLAPFQTHPIVLGQPSHQHAVATADRHPSSRHPRLHLLKNLRAATAGSAPCHHHSSTPNCPPLSRQDRPA
jgi:hypothetical protein